MLFEMPWFCSEEYFCLLQVSYQKEKASFINIFACAFYKNLNHLFYVRGKNKNLQWEQIPK